MSQRTNERKRPAAEGGAARLRVRMYRVGLGDCFLLTFDPDSDHEEHVLIDMGTIATGGGAKMDAVVSHLLETTGGELRAVVATHEHEDHVSGFRTLARREAQVGEVWTAWTEDADDPDAQKLTRYRGDLFEALAAAGARLEQEAGAAPAGMARGVRELLSFTGLADGEPLAASAGLKKRPNEAMGALLGMVPPEKRLFLSPGMVLEPAWAPGVRVYVLGPPRNLADLEKMGEHGSRDLYELGAAAHAGAGPPATQGDEAGLGLPFDERFMLGRDDPLARGVAAAYGLEAWRTIEQDGLMAAADFALQLDDLTNNTSLVLAFEVDGHVLLFVGDAQLGNWLSWRDVAFTIRDGNTTRTVRSDELLDRTVFYKVGHHASHNATASERGLELMHDPGLTAFIPVDEAAASRKDWVMPAPKLFARLREKTHGRVLRSDEPGANGEPYVDFLLPSPGVTRRTRPSRSRHAAASAVTREAARHRRPDGRRPGRHPPSR